VIEPVHDSQRAGDAFVRLQQLAGSWRLVSPDNDARKAFRISYRTISRGTALVEIFGDPSADVTETMYHLDGSHLMATHYCAQGNQPRLRLAPDSTPTVLHFTFFDVTNLAHRADSHLVDLKLTLEPDEHLRREETYRANGEDQRSTLLLERSPTPP
jgi:hypothetical protein